MSGTKLALSKEILFLLNYLLLIYELHKVGGCVFNILKH